MVIGVWPELSGWVISVGVVLAFSLSRRDKYGVMLPVSATIACVTLIPASIQLLVEYQLIKDAEWSFRLALGFIIPIFFSNVIIAVIDNREAIINKLLSASFSKVDKYINGKK